MAGNGPITNFKLPKDAKAYVSIIQDRVRYLIESQLWLGMELERVDQWFSNYTSDEEKYFAARILDALIYRSKPQTEALIDNLFTRYVPEVIRRCKGYEGTDSGALITMLREHDDPGVRIVPVIRDDDPPTKSGPLVVRIIKRHLRLREKWMIWPFKIGEIQDKAIKVYLFVDDFLGTGTQFCKFVERNNLVEVFNNSLCIYAPLAACQAGIDRLSEEYPELVITASEVLEHDSHIFSEHSECFSDGTNTPDGARVFYENLLQRISGKPKEKNKLAYGYGHLGVVYAFEHASPNASIPLLWYEYDGFTPLFDR